MEIFCAVFVSLLAPHLILGVESRSASFTDAVAMTGSQIAGSISENLHHRSRRASQNSTKISRSTGNPYSDEPQTESWVTRQARGIQILSLLSSCKLKVFGPTRACYEDQGVGCFSLKDSTSSVMTDTCRLPVSPTTLNIAYELRTPTSRSGTRMAQDGSLAAAPFDPTRGLRVVFPGMNEEPDVVYVEQLRDALLDKFPENVIVVDWRNGNQVDFITNKYDQAAANSELAGRLVAVFLNRIKNEVGIGFDKMHIIGQSLGAQAAGFAGSWLQKITSGQKLGRISGLDPAKPLFHDKPSYTTARYLDASDADFVDIVHVNAGKDPDKESAGLGYACQCGHVDFYPNGGQLQPSCPDVVAGYAADLKTGGYSWVCSHIRGYYYYRESILNSGSAASCQFETRACADFGSYQKGDCFADCSSSTAGCGSMGINAQSATGRGKQYIQTIPQPHLTENGFCGFSYKVYVKLSSSQGSQLMTVKAALSSSSGSQGNWVQLSGPSSGKKPGPGETMTGVALSPTSTPAAVALSLSYQVELPNWLKWMQWLFPSVQKKATVSSVRVVSGSGTEFIVCISGSQQIQSTQSFALSQAC